MSSAAESHQSSVATIPALQAAPETTRRQRCKAAERLVPRRFVNVRDVAERLGISVPSVWRNVASGRLPTPCYPSPGAARWDLAELDLAMEALKARPQEAMAARRAARIAADQNNAA
jgi:predicted DNA-binding transcriptional regulator AlpA